MFIVVSPAKTLDFANQPGPLPARTDPRFLAESEQLVGLLRAKGPADIARLMKVSDKIARLNAERFALWQKDMTSDAARAAVFAFRGGVYAGLDIDRFNETELNEAQTRLRILSGLYGLLRPLDRIRPYRLEMGTKLGNSAGKDLYHFWGDKPTQQLAADMHAQGSAVLVNLASQEYFKVIHPKTLPATVVSPRFEDAKNGQYKVISFYAKKARGLMAAWILRKGITRAHELAAFNGAGYAYDAVVSTLTSPVFRRSEAS